MPSSVIRPIVSSDIPKIRALNSALLPVSYPLSFYLQLLLHPSRICLLAHTTHAPHTPIAFIAASISPPSTPSPRRRRHQRTLTAAYTVLPQKPAPRSRSNSATTTTTTAPPPPSPPPPQIVEIVCNEPRVHILTLAVLPQYQRAGIAKKLVLEAVHKLRDAYDCDSAATAASTTTTTSSSSSTPSPTSSCPKLPCHYHYPPRKEGTLVTAHVSSSNAPAQNMCRALGMEPDGNIVRHMFDNGILDTQLIIGRVH